MKTNTLSALCCLTLLLAGGLTAFAHCDTLSGPVVLDAQHAIASQDLAPVLKWIRATDEPEIRSAFDRTLKVRAASADAAALADEFFFSTLVRVHRAGEGAPFTGLKASPPGAIEQASDRALETGETLALAEHLASQLKEKIAQKAAGARALRAHAGHNVAAGRAYVAAYVDYTHFVEAVARLADAAPTDAHNGHTH